MGSIEFFQPCTRAVLPELFVFAFAETKEAHCISKHDPLDLGVIVSEYPTARKKKIITSGNGLGENSLGKRSSCAIIDQSVP